MFNQIPILAEMKLQPIMSMASLARTAGEEVLTQITKMTSALNEANLFMSQFHLFTMIGAHDFAREMQSKALHRCSIYRIFAEKTPTIRLLALMAPGDATENMPLDYLIEGSDIQLDLLYISPDKPLPTIIPDHDVAIIALCMSKNTQPLLEVISQFIEQWPRQVLNLPNHIQRCYRDSLYQQLETNSNLWIPPSIRVDRVVLEKLENLDTTIGELLQGGNYPLTLRPVDFHGGKAFSRIDHAKSLLDYLEATPEEEFFVSLFIDYCNADGLYRKARIALIDGRPYVCHLAISEHWIVHYQSSRMAENSDKRKEEEAFMQNFDTDFALRHQDSFNFISMKLELDYAVIDCAETADGRLLIFEIDNVGWVHSTDPVEIFPYKQVQMNKVFAAFRSMLLKKINACHFDNLHTSL